MAEGRKHPPSDASRASKLASLDRQSCGARRLFGSDLLGPVIQRRVGLAEKGRASRIMQHDLLQRPASYRILELKLMTKEVPSMEAEFVVQKAHVVGVKVS